MSVQSEELRGVPGGLPAERIEGLGIRTTVGDHDGARDGNNQQVSQQQQQMKDEGKQQQQQQQQQQ